MKLVFNNTGSFEASCRAKGYPTPSISWDTRLLQKHGRNFTVTDGPDGGKTINVYNLTGRDTGQLYCHASNDANTMSTSLDLVVQGWDNFRRFCSKRLSKYITKFNRSTQNNTFQDPLPWNKYMK